MIRRIHPDFHIPHYIYGVAAEFDGEAFAASLIDAEIDSVVIFAKDMYGFSFWKNTVGRRHPGLGERDFFGEAHQLPRAISGHMNYYLWGIPNQEITTLISYGFTVDDLAPICDSLDQVGLIAHPLAKAKNNKLPIYVCETSRATLQHQWSQFQRFDHNEQDHAK